jgi:phage-related protein
VWALWVGVVTAISLAVIAVAAIAVAIAAVVTARWARSVLHTLEQLAGPALSDVRQLVGTIKTEADALVGTARDIRHRIVQAADAAQARLSDLDALVEVVQEEVEDTVVDAAAALKRVRGGFSLLEWGRKALRRRRRRR